MRDSLTEKGEESKCCCPHRVWCRASLGLSTRTVSPIADRTIERPGTIGPLATRQPLQALHHRIMGLRRSPKKIHQGLLARQRQPAADRATAAERSRLCRIIVKNFLDRVAINDSLWQFLLILRKHPHNQGVGGLHSLTLSDHLTGSHTRPGIRRNREFKGDLLLPRSNFCRSNRNTIRQILDGNFQRPAILGSLNRQADGFSRPGIHADNTEGIDPKGKADNLNRHRDRELTSIRRRRERDGRRAVGNLFSGIDRQLHLLLFSHRLDFDVLPAPAHRQ